MKIHWASDHAGYKLKTYLLKYFSDRGWEVVDHGTDSEESCDYPLLAEKACSALLSDSMSKGILICGSGIGMSIVANKIKGIRAACVSEEKSASLARQHNDAQVLCIGARIVGEKKAVECVEAFLEARFDTENPRHRRRVALIEDLEKRGE